MYRGAMRSILSELIRSERLLVVEDFALEKPKTKEMAARLATLGVSDVLVVTAERNDTLALASRNLLNVEVQNCGELNPVSLLAFDTVVMTVAAAKRLEERFE
jgi:large subunit ribosomal protein L4